MMMYTNSQGWACWLQEIQDRCFNPYDALGVMRNEAVLDAQNAGFEYLCMLDADVLPQPDYLIRLLKWQLPIVAPYVVEPGSGKPLHGPTFPINTGVHPARWCVLSMLLFKTAVFNCTDSHFWDNPMGADEGYHFKTLYRFGHQPWVDTSTQLIVSKIPTYPLATNRMTPAERQEFWNNKLAGLQKEPDRRPLDQNSPHQQNGIYMPFITKPAPVAPGTLAGLPGQIMIGTRETRVG